MSSVMSRGIGIAAAMLVAGLAGCASSSTGSTMDTTAGRRIQDAGVRGDLIGGAGASGGSLSGAAGEVTLRQGPDIRQGEEQVDASLSASWGALVLFLSEAELPVGRADAANGIAEIRGRLPRMDRKRMSHWVDCGSNIRGEVADNSYIDVVMNIQLRPGADQTTLLTTEFVGQAQPRDNQTARIPCRSRGTFEAYVAEQVRLRVAGD